MWRQYLIKGEFTLADETEKTADAVTETTSPTTEIKEPAPEAKAPIEASPAAKASTAGNPPRKGEERHLLSVFGETMKHIDHCEKDKTIIFRHNDRKSVMFMLAAFVVEVLLMVLFVANSASRPIYIALAVLADFLFGLAILWYVLLRFGVLRSFEPRQTLLTWQLMIGAGALFAFYTMNIAFGFFTYYNYLSTQIVPPL